MPTFSNGWLHNFQARRSVRWHRQHREEGSVSAQADQEMLEIKQVLSAYSLKDQFNYDETGLF